MKRLAYILFTLATGLAVFGLVKEPKMGASNVLNYHTEKEVHCKRDSCSVTGDQVVYEELTTNVIPAETRTFNGKQVTENFSKRQDYTKYFDLGGGVGKIVISRDYHFQKVGNNWLEIKTSTTTPTKFTQIVGFLDRTLYQLREYALALTTSGTEAFCQSLISVIPTTNQTCAGDSIMYIRSSATWRTLDKWTLPSDPGGGTVTDVDIGTVGLSTESGTDTVNMYRITQSGTTSGATWNTYDGSTSWTSAGGDYNATVIDTRANDWTANQALTWGVMGGNATNSYSLTWGDIFIPIWINANADSADFSYAVGKRPSMTITYTAAGGTTARRRVIITE